MAQSGRFILCKCRGCGETFLVDTEATKQRIPKHCDACLAEKREEREASLHLAAMQRRSETAAGQLAIRQARADLEYKALHTRVAVTVANGVRIERRGTVPAGCRAAGFIHHS